jgi:hypothetical protein
MEVKEFQLTGRKFTWSNHQQVPTLSKIDRAFCSTLWEEQYPSHILHPLSSSSSDHCPLLLAPLILPMIKPIFRFEAHWPKMPGFMDCI